MSDKYEFRYIENKTNILVIEWHGETITIQVKDREEANEMATRFYQTQKRMVEKIKTAFLNFIING